MITLPCPQCGGEFMQVETENALDLICLSCATDPPEARKHRRIEPTDPSQADAAENTNG